MAAPAEAAAAAPAEVKEKKGRKRHRKESWAVYIHDVMTDVFRESGAKRTSVTISRRAMTVMEGLVQNAFDRLYKEAAFVTRLNNRETLDAREVQYGVKLLIKRGSGQPAAESLQAHALSYGTKAVAKLQSSYS